MARAVVVLIAELMITMDASLVIVALPSATKALDISIQDRQWVLSAYALTFAGFLLLGGRLADFFGRKTMFIIGLAGFATVSGLAGLATSDLLFILARAGQGLFAAILAPALLALVNVSFHEVADRAKAFSAFAAVAAVGGVFGLLFGGTLVEFLSWRWCLLVNVPVAIIAIVLAVPIVRPSRAEGKHRLNAKSAIVGTLAIMFLVIGFGKASPHPFNPTTDICVVLGLILGAVFILIQRKSRDPLLPLSILTDRNRGAAFLNAMIFGGVIAGFVLFSSYYLQTVLNFAGLNTALALLPFGIAYAVVAVISGRILPRFGPRTLITIGYAIAAVGLFWISTIGTTDHILTDVFPGMVLFGGGCGLASAAVYDTALSRIPHNDAGIASATVNTSQQIGDALGSAILNTIAIGATATYLVVHGKSEVAAASVAGFSRGFIAAGVLMVIGALISFFMINIKPKALVD